MEVSEQIESNYIRGSLQYLDADRVREAAMCCACRWPVSNAAVKCPQGHPICSRCFSAATRGELVEA